MNIFRTFAIFLGTAPALFAAPTDDTLPSGVLSNCSQMVQCAKTPDRQAAFDIRATVLATAESDNKTHIFAQDDTAACTFEPVPANRYPLRPGDRVRLRGSIGRNCFGEPLLCLSSATEIVHGPAPEPVDIHPDSLKTGRFDNRLVRIRGVVHDIVRDDIDPLFRFFVIASSNRIVYVATRNDTSPKLGSSGLLGARVTVTGICNPCVHSLSRHVHRRIERTITPIRNGIVVERPARRNTEGVGDIWSVATLMPEDMPFDRRFRARGRILAVWQGASALLQTSRGPIIEARFADSPPPRTGDSVEIIGFPKGNLFTLGLTGAVWQPIPSVGLPTPAVTNVTVRELMEDGEGRFKVNVRFHGSIIRTEGTVQSLRDEGTALRLIMLADGYHLPIEIGTNGSACAGIPVGSRIAVTGVCVMDIDDWSPGAPFPRVRGFSIVPSSPDGVSVLARPSWWTPARLAIVLFSILAVLLGSAALNVSLKRLVERRSRQLEREIGVRVASESKTRERTRLAVELHDAISQNMTGIAFELQTVRNCADGMTPNALKHLDVAERTLGSCRDELRNCLWDLRSNALELTDMNEAIRQTLKPHLGNARLTVRFDVARARFTDNLAHALLHIIRELTVNAIRHGRASHVKVAGCVDGGRLRFSVADDGCGFDPAHCPGLEQGHFGLLGIRERIDGFEGEFSITSNSSGTKATASMAFADREEANERP